VDHRVTAALGVHGTAVADPDRVAIVAGDRAVTFGELDAMANRLAQVLADAGVVPGDRVAVLMRNGPEVFAAWNAVARLGALAVPIPTRAAPPEVDHLLSDSGAVALIHDTEGLVDRLSQAPRSVWHVGDGAFASASSAPPRTDFLGSPLVTMNYTSGTSGVPKGIARGAPQPASTYAGNAFMRFWEFGRDDVHLLCGPAYHTAPGAYAQMHLMEGALVVTTDRFDADECLRLIEQQRITTSHMVPSNFVRILRTDWARHDRSSVRKILHAAAPCPVPVKRQILDVFPDGAVWEYYGMSEGMATVISPAEWLRKPGSVGRAFPGLEIKVLGDDGRELPPGAIGLVYVSVVPGYAPFHYHNDDDKTAAAWRDGFYTVGDLGSLDEDGFLMLADRRTDLIIRGGVNIYPAEVESALAEHPDVVDAAVLGLPDDDLGQRVHAVVELRPGATCDPPALTVHLRDLLAPYKVPVSWDVVDELPREPTGKIRKRELRDAALAAGDDPESAGKRGWEPEVAELHRRAELAQQMGGEEKVARHHAAGRLTVRERIGLLVDPGSFREVGGLAGRAEYEGSELTAFTPANFVMGRAHVDRRPVVVAGDDFTVRGGAADGGGHGKQMYAEQMAHDLRIPIVRLIDGSGGGGSVRSLERTKRTYVPTDPSWPIVVDNLATIPVVALVLGSVAGQGAARAVTSHYSVMVKGTSQLFVAGPPVVARTGEQVDSETLGGSHIHTRNGVIDDEADSEADAMARARRFLSYLPSSVHALAPRVTSDDDPERRDDWLVEAIPRDRRKVYRSRPIIDAVVDRGSFFEIGVHFGRAAVTGLARLDGWPVAVLAGDPYQYGGGCTAAASQKVMRFVDLADTFHLPVVHLVDQPGFVVGTEAEREATIRHGARTIAAIVQARVPWCSVLLRRVFGIAGAAHHPATRHGMRFAWPSGDWGSLPLEGGIEAAYQAELEASEDPDARRAEIEARLNLVRSPFRTAEAFLVEDVIDPRDTRPRLCEFAALAAAGLEPGPRARGMRP
jgi:acetyl-CoA carboxylase carboxyltransferase component/acyl-CoA synthetase (AMP-forming)/AMP-acid ligase II